jgi:signal peptidase I
MASTPQRSTPRAADVSRTPAPAAPASKSVLREYAEALTVAILLALVIRTFVVQAFKIPSSSMEPTLLIGDHILVNKFIYGVRIPFVGGRLLPFTSPERQDVIVFVYPEDPSKDFIKRVVAVGGDTVEVRDKKVHVNGVPAEDPHAFYAEGGKSRRDKRDNMPATVVPEGKLFVMGDNRDRSYDSRFWGFVDVGDVKGKAFIIYFSWNSNADSVPEWVRWGRLGDLIR